MAADTEAIGGGRGSKVRHGLKNRAEIPAGSETAERDATEAYVADAARSVRGNVEEIRQLLAGEPELQPKTLFEYLQRTYPERFRTVRTLWRRIKSWRATEGPPREVFFAQEHRPGELRQSDFTRCRDLGVTIDGQSFPHLIYHFVLTYSNWETGTVCYSESFESLSQGLQNALWELGGIRSSIGWTGRARR